MPKTIVITGANGNVAGATIAALKGADVKLRGLVRDEKKGEALRAQGVELVVGDLEKPRSLGNVFTGADVAFVIVPPGPRAPEQTSNAVWAARQAGVKHIVRLSAGGAAHDAPTINSRLHALSDAELERGGITYTILKPHFFMQNLMGMGASIKSEGALYFPMGEAKMPMIDVRDIGEAAAKILTNPAVHANKTYTITGPEAVDFNRVAAAIGKGAGKAVKYVNVPIEGALAGMKAMGMDAWQLVLMEDYMRAYASGWINQTTPDFQAITGKPARSIEDFGRDFGGFFK